MPYTSKSAKSFSAVIAVFLLLSMGTYAQSNPEVQKQMDDLKQQITLLKTQLAELRAVINTNSNGNLTVTNGASRADAIGAQYNQTVGGSGTINITGSSITIVGTNKSETIGMNMSSSIGSSLSLSIGNRYNISTGRDIVIEAGDQIMLKSGNAYITIKKNGDIEFKGNVILPQVTKDMLIKGSKIQ